MAKRWIVERLFFLFFSLSVLCVVDAISCRMFLVFRFNSALITFPFARQKFWSISRRQREKEVACRVTFLPVPEDCKPPSFWRFRSESFIGLDIALYRDCRALKYRDNNRQMIIGKNCCFAGKKRFALSAVSTIFLSFFVWKSTLV